MRTAALLVLLAGCDLIFDLRGPESGSVELRRGFSDSVVADTRLRIGRPPDVEPDDLLVAVIKADSSDDLALIEPPGLTVFATTSALGCTVESWTVWFLSGRAGTDDRYEFEFGALPRPADGKNHSGMIAAYTNAGSASLIAQVNAGDLITDSATAVELGEDASEPGSIMWIGAVASVPWTKLFTEGTKIAVEENLAMFELEITDGVIPAMTYELPDSANNSCAGLAQVRIER